MQNEVDSFRKILADNSCRAIAESEQEAQKSPRFQSEAALLRSIILLRLRISAFRNQYRWNMVHHRQ